MATLYCTILVFVCHLLGLNGKEKSCAGPCCKVNKAKVMMIVNSIVQLVAKNQIPRQINYTDNIECLIFFPFLISVDDH